ncbi:hypothetical protein SEEH3374_02615, partial [Salmonella enterica subsp. enterica serovar Heidelberg str. RI-11-013374]
MIRKLLDTLKSSLMEE